METVNKKQKKAGRPHKAVKKDIRACVRFSNHEYFIIKEKAKEAGVNASAYIRQTAIQSKITSRLSEEDLQVLRKLVGMSNNMNQVAKVCHREGLFEAMQYFESYRNEFDTLLKKFKP